MGVGEDASRLSAALEAVQDTLHNEAAHRLFAKPVDHVGLNLTDYLEIIGHQPMDLGTISQRLKEGKRSNFRRSSQYSSAAAVLADVEQAFANCLRYNNGPGADNKHIRSEAAEARQAFLVAWQRAKLQGPDPRVPESKPKARSRPEKSQPTPKTPASQRACSAAATPVTVPRVPQVRVLPPELPPLDPASCLPEGAIAEHTHLSFPPGRLLGSHKSTET